MARGPCAARRAAIGFAVGYTLLMIALGYTALPASMMLGLGVGFLHGLNVTLGRCGSWRAASAGGIQRAGLAIGLAHIVGTWLTASWWSRDRRGAALTSSCDARRSRACLRSGNGFCSRPFRFMAHPDKPGPARALARALVAFYYPRIEVTGGALIPRGRPVLQVGEPSEFADRSRAPGNRGAAAGRLMAKAPLFDLPVFGTVLRALGMVPAYRGTDDAKPVGRNLESLAVAARQLAAGGVMGIFPEGKSHDAVQLALVRSGAARLALQAVAARSTSSGQAGARTIAPMADDAVCAWCGRDQLRAEGALSHRGVDQDWPPIDAENWLRCTAATSTAPCARSRRRSARGCGTA